MLKLSDRFSIKKIPSNWELIETVESDHHSAKTGFVKERRWYPTLKLVLERLLDAEISDIGEDLSDLKVNLDKALEDVKQMAEIIEKNIK